MSFRLLTPVAFLLLVAGCGPQVTAPSLLPRPVEKLPVELPQPTHEPETAADPALTSRLAALVASAEAADRRFARTRVEVEKTIASARNAAPGSEAWTVAQQALSTLDIARGPLHETAAAIDALRQEPATAGTGNRNAIDAAAQRIAAIEQGQAQAIAMLQGRLR